MVVYDFSKNEDQQDWYITNDGVMGGVSEGEFKQNHNGYGVFSGRVSLKNNGGFTSLHYNIGLLNVSSYSIIKLRLKGDGKKYQFRLKAKINDSHSYMQLFSADKTWQVLEFKLGDFIPVYRGRKLSLPNFNADAIEKISFLIANGKEESFELFLDKIEIF